MTHCFALEIKIIQSLLRAIITRQRASSGFKVYVVKAAQNERISTFTLAVFLISPSVLSCDGNKGKGERGQGACVELGR